MANVGKDFCPDGSDIWLQGPAAASCNLFDVLPDGRFDSQPVVTDHEAGCVLVADARIDNRKDLLTRLGISTQEGRQLSDARLILAVYKQWGQNCADRLIGDFAFAVWNFRDHTLFCCRDVFGIRPFYYIHTNALFAFASDVHSLLALNIVPKEIDETWIADMLGGLHSHQNETEYRFISTLPPAHNLTLKNGNLQQLCYWAPDVSRQIHYSHDEDYVQNYLEILTESVSCRLAGSSPDCVASMISGGLDSSSISAIAAKHQSGLGQTLSAFCHVLPDNQPHPVHPDGDEKELVKLLERVTNGLSVNFVSADNFMPESLPSDEPFDPCGLHWTYFLGTTILLAKEKGCRVLLDGFGGDQVATCQGQMAIRWALRSINIRAVTRHTMALANLHKRSVLLAVMGVLWHYQPIKVRNVTSKQLRSFLYERCALNKDFADRLDIMGLARRSRRFGRKRIKPLNKEIFKKLSTGKKPNSYSIGALSARYQIEWRYPMYDRRLVEYCLAVPPEQHRLGYGRRLIRRAMKGILPDEIRLRDNKRFSSNPGIQRIICQHLSHYKRALDQALAIPEVAEYVDIEKIRKRLEELPYLVHNGRQREFILGATMRAFKCAQILSRHFGNMN